MPRIPTDDDLGMVQGRSMNVPRRMRDSVTPAIERAGGAIQGVSNDVSAVIEKRRDEEDALDLARARADWNRRRIEEDEQYRLDKQPRYDKWEAGYGKNIQGHRTASASLIRNQKLRQRFEIETEDDIATGLSRVRGRAYDIDADKRRAEGLASIENNLETAARADQETADKIIAQTRADIDNLVASGTLTPAAAIEARQRFAKRYAGIKVMQDIQNDPELAYSAIEGGPGEIYYAKLRKQEGSGKNPKSSANGHYQFLEGTWAEVMKKHPELGLTAGGRTDRGQADRAIRAFTNDNIAALQAAGIPPSEANLYLAHFMGAGGAIKMLQANPETNAAAMFPKEAKANPTIFFNSDGSPRGIGEVVALQTEGFSTRGGPAPDYYALLEPEDRIRLAASAQGEWAAREKETRERSQIERYNVQTQIENDIDQIRETGQAADIDPAMVIATLGEDDAAKWLDKRKAAARTYEAVSVIPSMTNDQIEEHLASLEPSAGDDDFKNRQDTYEAAEKRAKTIQDLRLKDPAKAVEDSPIVKAALEGYNPDDPAAVQRLIKARLAAQEQVEIPRALQKPVTRKEAYAIIAPIQTTLDMIDSTVISALGQAKGDASARRAAVKTARAQAEAQLRETIDGIEQRYGSYAQPVLAFAIAESVRDKEIGNLASVVFRKIAKGEKPTITEMVGLEDAQDASVAEKAVDGKLPKPRTEAVEPGPAAKPAATQPAAAKPSRANPAQVAAPPEGGWPAPSDRAVQFLIANPDTAAQFDGIYGPGAAARWTPKTQE